MSKFTRSVSRVFQGGAKAFSRFPASMLSAIVVAAIASILIHFENIENEKLYVCLQLAFAFGAFLGMAVAVLVTRLTTRVVPFVLANFGSILASAGVFALLYFRAGEIPSITISRIVAASAIAFLAFLLVISRDASRNDYNQASFMTLKSALIAMIYALAILGGLCFTAFAVETLLYKNMSEKVYEYIAVWSLFSWFAFFLGYFPNFRKGEEDERLPITQKHPAFIEILFSFVFIPLMMIMTAVLLIWAVQILIVGNWPVFSQLTSIFSAYTLFGIFLSIMVGHYVRPIAAWFRRLFPFAALVFLAFEAIAIFKQVGKGGIKTAEYFVSLIWIYVLLSVVIMIIWPVVKNRLTAFLAIILIFAAVLPFTGYQDLPIASQTSRLRLVLNKNDMLADSKIQKAPSTISKADKTTITNATYFLLDYNDVTRASWFENAFKNSATFESVYGFEPVYEDYENYNDVQYTYLMLPDGSFKVGDYDYAACASEMKSGFPLYIQTGKGKYTIALANTGTGYTPVLQVSLDGKVLISENLKARFDKLEEKYKGQVIKEPSDVELDDMLLKLDKDGLKLLVVFDRIELTTRISTEEKTYTAMIHSVYLAE